MTFFGGKVHEFDVGRLNMRCLSDPQVDLSSSSFYVEIKSSGRGEARRYFGSRPKERW